MGWCDSDDYNECGAGNDGMRRAETNDCSDCIEWSGNDERESVRDEFGVT
jgi:hypothetical protein